MDFMVFILMALGLLNYAYMCVFRVSRVTSPPLYNICMVARRQLTVAKEEEQWQYMLTTDITVNQTNGRERGSFKT